MAFTMDGIIDPDETQRFVDFSVDDQLDAGIVIESNGKPLHPGREREFFDGNPRLPVKAFFNSWMIDEGVEGAASLQTSGLMVVRACDGVSASLMSLMKQRDLKIKATLSVFDVGGSDLEMLIRPIYEIRMDKVYISHFNVCTSPRHDGPVEVFRLVGREFEIHTAPKIDSGLPGAARIFQHSFV